MNIRLDELNLLVLNVGYAEHDGDWNWEDVKSPFARLYLVTGGHAGLRIGSTLYQLTPGHLYLIPSFVCHTDICDSLFSHYYIHIYEDSSSDFRLFEDWHFPLEVPAGDMDLQLFRRLCAINPSKLLPQSDPVSYDNNSTLLENIRKNKEGEFCGKVESRGIVYQLVSRFLKEAGPKEEVGDDRVQKALSYIRKNIGKKMDLGELAEMLCMSKDHFIRIFKKETGESPINYITSRKLERAMLLLATEDTPVKAIAFSLGFDDHSYFNRVFKAHIGMTPQQYREKKKR